LIVIGLLAGMVIVTGRPVAAWPVRHADGLFRDDPRPAGDLPISIGPDWQQQPTGRRRTTRRARRRAQRRGWEEATPPRPGDGIEVVLPVEPHSRLRIDHRDIPYAQASEHHRFDIFLPGGCRQGRLPLVVWLPGEDWSKIDRSDCPVLWLTSHGYAVATIRYRPSTVSQFPAQRDDCRNAIRQLVADAALWGIAPDRIAVVGRAGGGQLAALLGLDGDPAEAAADPLPPPMRIAAICGISPVTHLPTLGPEHDKASSAASRLIGGPLPELREAALAASPLRYASPGDPPTLLIHARNATFVPVSQSERLHAALQVAGVESQLVISDEADPAITASGRVGQLLLAFLDRTLNAVPASVVVDEPPVAGSDG
jgi:acetyl esterase/lipase